MATPIIIKTLKGDTEDLAIIELQGDLRSSLHDDENYFEGKFIGDLYFTKNGTPLLIIGHHLLYGKEVSLEKPLAVLEMKKTQGSVEYQVKTIITKKLLFKTRPKPIVK